MSLTIETGGVISGADTYIDIAYADTYLASVGHASWAALSTPDKESALRIAARYLNEKNFTGSRETYEQELAWPRNNAVFDDVFAVPSSSVPENIKRAQCEAAALSAAGTLTNSVNGFVIEERVGGITRRYSDYSKNLSAQQNILDGLLKPLLASCGSRSSHKVVRG
jgi:hypothetical protein